MPTKLSPDTLHQLALGGAKARLIALREEEASLLKAFPELKKTSTKVKSPSAAPKKKRAFTMSAAQKKVVSQRMKRYWAERRKAKDASK